MPPLYFQHDGHSRTIVGASKHPKTGTIQLVVLDPSCRGAGTDFDCVIYAHSSSAYYLRLCVKHGIPRHCNQSVLSGEDAFAFFLSTQWPLAHDCRCLETSEDRHHSTGCARPFVSRSRCFELLVLQILVCYSIMPHLVNRSDIISEKP